MHIHLYVKNDISPFRNLFQPCLDELLFLKFIKSTLAEMSSEILLTEVKLHIQLKAEQGPKIADRG